MMFSITDFQEINNHFVSGHRKDFPVLLVDDDLVFRELAKVYLEAEGYQIVAVDSADVALKMLQEKDFPIVLCDWMMPGLDGIDFCKRLRENDQPYRYIIMLSSKNESDEIVHGLRAGADDYIIKGGRKPELIARLDCGVRVLAQHSLLQQQKMEILRKSQTDHLTGTFNRGYLMDYLPREVKRSIRYGKPLSVVMCDIDFFKKINDKFGHLGGDHALIAFANRLEINLRKDVDWVARYGGEEFVIVLPDTSYERAMIVAEKLRYEVQEADVIWEDKKITLTASFGVASLDDQTKGVTATGLLELADKRLYQSKTEGRNRCTGRDTHLSDVVVGSEF